MFSWPRLQDKNQHRVELSVSSHTVARVLVIILLFVIFWGAVKQASHALTLIFIGFFLALALNAPVNWLAQRLPGKGKGNRTVATVISFFVIIGFLLGFIGSIIPPLIRQTSNFIDAAPGLVADVRDESSGLGEFVRRYSLEDEISKLSGQLSDRLDDLGGTALSRLTRVTGSVFSVLTILVLAFMMLIEGPRWINFFKRLAPDGREKHLNRIVGDMYRVIKGYVNGQVTLAIIASLMILAPLLILGIDYPIALIVIVFIAGLIPLVGHTFGAVIVSTVALFESVPAAIIILSYYILYQQIENYVIQPKIQANSTNMSPLLVFSSVVVGASLGGLLGGLVAIPVAGCARIAILDYLESRKLLSPAEVKEATTAD